MKATDKPDFLALVADVLAYHRQPASEFVLGVWWEACKAFSMEQVQKALQAHAMDPERGRFAPLVADVVRVLQGTTTDRAAVAWGRVLTSMQGIGAYSDIDFGDPAIHAAVRDLGGWPKLCRSDLNELRFVQGRFCESYRAYVARGVLECPMVLMGDRSPDVEYEKKGLPLPAARLVGEKPCAEVMRKAPTIANDVLKALGGGAA